MKKLIFLAWVAIFCDTSRAAIIAIPTTANLVKQSDVIVIASVDRSDAVKESFSRIHVVQVIKKGDAPISNQLDVFRDSNNRRSGHIGFGTSLLFLKKDGANLIPLSGNSSISLPLELRVQAISGNPENAVADVLAEGLKVSSVKYSPRSTLIVGPLLIGSDIYYRTASQALRGMETQYSTKLLTDLGESLNGPARLWVLSALVSLGDVNALNKAAPYAIAPEPAYGAALWGLAQSLSEFSATEGETSLLQLMDSPVASIQNSALQALERVGTDAAIPYLLRNLQNPNAQVRYQSSQSLASITKQPNGLTTFDKFTSNEKKQVKFWMDWSKKHGSIRRNSKSLSE